MFSVGEVLTFISVKVDVVTIDLGSAPRGEVIPALDTNLNIVILECYERKSLSPVLTKKEGNHVMVASVVFLAGVSSHRERSLSRRIAHEWVVNTLNIEGIEFGHLLTTNPESEFGGVGSGVGEKASRVLLNLGDTISLDPDIAHEVTLGADGNCNLVRSTKSADVIHALRLHGEVGVALIVLTKEADLGVTRDVHILGTHRHELN